VGEGEVLLAVVTTHLQGLDVVDIDRSAVKHQVDRFVADETRTALDGVEPVHQFVAFHGLELGEKQRSHYSDPPFLAPRSTPGDKYRRRAAAT